jgi:cytochrome P450
MLRSTWQIRADPLGFLAATRDRFGDVAQFPIPQPPTYLLASADASAHVLVRNARHYDKSTIQYRSLSLVTGDGLLTSDGEAWRSQRTMSQPAFHRSSLERLERICHQEVASVVDGWARPARPVVVDVAAAMADLTLRIVGRALFGDDLRGRSAVLADATIAALKVVIQRSRVPITVPSSWPTPANRRLAGSLAALDSAVDDVVASRGPAAAPPLLIDLFLDAGWPSHQVRDQIVTFLVAGHETAASALTWALWLLAGDPAAQERVAGRSDAAQLAAFEALRLYPPAWVITRQSRAADSIGGFRIPEGALVIVSPFLLHRDPRYWEQPGDFRLDRFAERAAQRSPAYLPFGAGPRLCIGRDFALLEMRTGLERICRGIRLRRADMGTPQPLPEVTLRPKDGLRLMVQPR